MAEAVTGPTAADASEERTELKRAVTPTMLLLFVVGGMVGGGIYALVGEVGGEVGGAIWVSFALAALLALVTAGSYAELVTKHPRAGGAALYAQRAFRRRLITFILGFAVMMSSITSAAALSRAFGGDYLSTFVDLPIVLVAIVVVALIALINLRGIGESVALNVVCTIVELTGLALVVLIGIAFLADGGGDTGRALEFSEDGTSPFFLALSGAALAVYALIGFEDSVNLAEEARHPRRAYPRALFGGLLIAATFYLVVTVVASMAVPTDTLAESDGPLLEVVRLGPLSVDDRIFSVIALFALANTTLINLITASRLLYGMGDEGVVPGVFRRVLPGRRTPVAAIVFTTLIAVGLIASGDLEKLADTTVTLLLFAFIGVHVAVLVDRRHPAEHDHFRVPTPIPVLGALACVGLLTQQEGEIFVRAAILVGIGLVLYLVNLVFTRREDRGDPANVSA
jgi:amino acid transporter